MDGAHRYLIGSGGVYKYRYSGQEFYPPPLTRILLTTVISCYLPTMAAPLEDLSPAVTGEGVQWAYSTCTGNKKALLVSYCLYFVLLSHLFCVVQIGINYVGTRSELQGCVNDVLNLRKFITGGFFRRVV